MFAQIWKIHDGPSLVEAAGERWWCAVSTHKVEVGVSGGLNCDLMCRMTVLEARVAVLRRMAFENGAIHRKSLMCAEHGRGWRAAWERR